MILKSVAAAVVLTLASRVEAGMCQKYQVVVGGEGDLVPNADVQRWAEYALKADGRFSAEVPCGVFISVLAMRIRNQGGIETGCVAAIYISTRRSEGPERTLIGEEHTTILTGPNVDGLRGRLRDAIEGFISKMK